MNVHRSKAVTGPNRFVTPSKPSISITLTENRPPGQRPVEAEDPPGRDQRAELAFVKLVAAGPLFFVSAWLLMLCAGVVGTDVGIEPFGCVTSMVVTIALWLPLAPAIGSGRTGGAGEKHC